MKAGRDIPRRSFYLMRHAQSTGNLKRDMPASSHYLLTTRGLGQAYLAHDLLSHLNPKPDRFVSSTMERAVETLTMMTGREPLPGNQEACLSEWYSQHESEEEHARRVLQCIGHRMEKNADETLFFVTHGKSIERVFEALQVEKPWHIRNADIFRFDPVPGEDGAWKAVRLHLENGKLAETSFHSTHERISAKGLLQRYMKPSAVSSNGQGLL